MGKKSPPPKAPDLTPISDAQIKIAQESNELAREYLGLSREQYAFFQENAKEELALAREQADRLFEYQNKAFDSGEQARLFAEQVGQKQMEAMDLQMEYARKDRERYDQVLVPMQDKYIAEANAYDTTQRRESEAAKASVDIQRQAEAARTNSDMRLRSMGIDPSQMRSASLLDTQNVALAAQQAGAANAARTGVEDRGRAMRADAMNVISGLPAQALAGYQSAQGAGAGAIGAAQAGQGATLGAIQGGAGVGNTAMGFRSGALGNLAQLTGSPTQWAGMGGSMMGQAANTYGAAGNTMSQNFNNQMSSWQAGQQQAQQNFSNVMGVAGMAAGMMMADGGAVTRERIEMAGLDYAPDMGALGPTAGAMGKGIRSSGRAVGRHMERRALGDAMIEHGSDVGNVWGDQPLGASSPMLLPSTVQHEDTRQYMAEGGQPTRVVPKRQQRDKYPAMLGEGEYVVPRDVVDALGIRHFDKLVEKYHREGA